MSPHHTALLRKYRGSSIIDIGCSMIGHGSPVAMGLLAIGIHTGILISPFSTVERSGALVKMGLFKWGLLSRTPCIIRRRPTSPKSSCTCASLLFILGTRAVAQ